MRYTFCALLFFVFSSAQAFAAGDLAKLRQVKYGEYQQYRQLMHDDGAVHVGMGVMKKALEPGKGIKAQLTDRIDITYSGKFLNGKVFSHSPKGKVVELRLGSMIPGLRLAISHMLSGETAEILVPFWQAYRAKGKGKIGPFENLLFDIKLVRVHRKSLANTGKALSR